MKNRRHLLIFCCFLLSACFPCRGQQTELERDFRTRMNVQYGESLPTIIKQITHSFLGTPYIARTLEGNKTEKLVCRFDGVDCTTLVENVLALSITKKKQADFNFFKDELTRIRYREGTINGYSSRLHYFTDWIYENSKRGILKDITQELGGIPLGKTINFMTAHTNLYPSAETPEVWDELRTFEDSINQRSYFYIPTFDIQKIEPLLNDGDIIGITSAIEGLDCNHMGIINKIGNRAYLLHASSVQKEVELSEVPLSQYVAGNKNNNGIMVVRPVDFEP